MPLLYKVCEIVKCITGYAISLHSTVLSKINLIELLNLCYNISPHETKLFPERICPINFSGKTTGIMYNDIIVSQL